MATTILVSTAAEQLGIEEEQLRELLQPLYGNHATVKRISSNTFKTIASQLQSGVFSEEENQNIDSHNIDVDAVEVSVLTAPEDKDKDSTDDTGSDASSFSSDSSPQTIGLDDETIGLDDESINTNSVEGLTRRNEQPTFSEEIEPTIEPTVEPFDNGSDCQGEKAITVDDSEDAAGRVQRLGTAEKDLREGTVQLKTEISKAQGRGAGVATGLAFMQGLLEGEQEVLDMFTNQSLEVFDQLQTTIDQQVTDISQGTGDLLGKITMQRALNQERLAAIRNRVASMIHKA